MKLVANSVVEKHVVAGSLGRRRIADITAPMLQAWLNEYVERGASASDECRLLAELTGRDHLIVRTFVQLGLRPEELFAFRRDYVQRGTSCVLTRPWYRATVRR